MGRGLAKNMICALTTADLSALTTLHAQCFDTPWDKSAFINLLKNGAFGWCVLDPLIDALGAKIPLAFILLRNAATETEMKEKKARVEDALHANKVAKDKILIERFTTGALSTAQVEAAKALQQEAAGRKVQITLDGRRRQFTFDAEKGSILENARAAGAKPPCSTTWAK